MIENFFIPLASALIVFLVAITIIRTAGSQIVTASKLFWQKVLTPDIRRDHFPKVIETKLPQAYRLLAWAGIKRLPSRVLLTSILILWILIIFWHQSLLLFVALIFGFAVFLIYVVHSAAEQKKKFITQLPDSLSALSQSLKAGYSLPDALAIVERESTKPTSFVFGALVRAENYRLSFAEALRVLQTEINAPEWNLVAESLFVQAKVGGNIIPVIEDIGSVLRDRIKVEQELASATAAGRYSGLIVALLAPVSFITMLFFAPDYVAILYTTFLGKLLLGLALVLELLGFFFVLKVLKLDF